MTAIKAGATVPGARLTQGQLMKHEEATVPPAPMGQVDQGVRPRALLLTHKDGRETLHPMDTYAVAYRDTAVSEALLYDQAALDAALNLWPRDCRLCANYTTQAGGCLSVVQCVDSMQFKATAPRQYWIAGPNA
jgi:hypothetical protein